MATLRAADFGQVLRLLRDLYVLRGLQDFWPHALRALNPVIPVLRASFMDIDPVGSNVTYLSDPPDRGELAPLDPFLRRYIHEHPLVGRAHHGWNGTALAISDCLSRAEYHRTALYNEVYRHVGTEDTLGITFPAPSPHVLGVALSRGRGPAFSPRDRLVLNLLRPHLAQAYRNAEVGDELAALAAAGGFIILTRDRRVVAANPTARRWLADYFDATLSEGRTLPEFLDRWVRAQHAHIARDGAVPLPLWPLRVERDGKRLIATVTLETDGFRLLFREVRTVVPGDLESLGVSRREADVLAWLARGKTNAEIGVILGIRPKTVSKHLERVFARLGVETRTAAARCALESVLYVNREDQGRVSSR